MNFLTTNHGISTLLLSCILIVGCQGTATDGKETDGTPDNANATSGQNQDTAARVLGKWKMDEEKSRAGWGDREGDLERMMVDEIGMGIEFKPDNAITISKNGRSGDGFWEVIEKSEDSITLEMSAKKDSKKKVQVKITFTGTDQILYQSSEMEFKEDMIFTRDGG